MRAGLMRRRVEFDAETLTPDGQGGNVRTWKPICTVWGQYTQISGNERIRQGRLQSEDMANLRVRYSDLVYSQVKTASRALVGGEVHNIRSITQPDQKRRMFDIVLERGVAPHG